MQVVQKNNKRDETMKIELILAEDVLEENDMKEETKKRFEYVIDCFKKINPNPTTELKYKNGYELLVAAILSAQTQDRRINMVTPNLFKKYPTVEDMAKATPDEILSFIGSVNYCRNKSDYLSRASNILVKKYNGKIPEDPDELQKIPGIGRKTANVIVSTLFNKQVISVDTHVMRVSERIGLTTDADKNPLETEEQLIRYTPKDVMSKISHWLILHGRYICTAKYPQCDKCDIRDICRYYRNSKKKGDRIDQRKYCQ